MGALQHVANVFELCPRHGEEGVDETSCNLREDDVVDSLCGGGPHDQARNEVLMMILMNSVSSQKEVFCVVFSLQIE